MKNDIFLSQNKYCKDILKKFEMEKCKQVVTLMSTSYYMDVDLAGKSVNQTKFRLLYLIASRPYIMCVVCLRARFQSNHKESYFTVAKKNLKYLKAKKCVGVWYLSNSLVTLIGYSDSDFTRCKLDWKSTSDTCHLLGSILISCTTRNRLVWLLQLQRKSIFCWKLLCTDLVAQATT